MRSLIRWLYPLSLTLAAVSMAEGFDVPRRLDEQGFVAIAEGRAKAAELTRQSNLWVMEVRFKPMRIIEVEMTDAETGRKEKKRVWYLVYQAVNRPQEKREKTLDIEPINVEDPPPGKPIFVPEFTLITNDNNRQQIYRDRILPEAQAAIQRRERKRLLNTVEAVRSLPSTTPEGAQQEQVIDGVVMWPDVDPSADYFRVLSSGFSNGYEIQPGPNGQSLVLRRTIVQEYWRPGDEIDPQETEIQLKGEPRWVYRPEGEITADLRVLEQSEDELEAPLPQVEQPGDEPSNTTPDAFGGFGFGDPDPEKSAVEAAEDAANP